MRIRLRHGEVDLGNGNATVDGRTHRLTTRELALLRYLAARPGADVPRDELLREAFGYAPKVASRAVDKAMNRLRGKLEPGLAFHLVTVHGSGYRFVPLAETRPADPRFVGRDAELLRVETALRAGAVVVTGPPGVGKTRLLQQIAARAERAVTFVDLSGVTTEDAALRAVAQALGVALVQDPLSHLARALRTLRPHLLLLDGPALARSAAGWASADVGVVVAAAEAPDGVASVPLAPLSEPDARDLLLARAPAGLSVEDAAGVVRHLDRLPLTIELAAARLALLPPAELQRRLVRDPLFVDEGRLRDVLAAHVAALDPEERAALAQLAAFPAPFDLEAAEAVVAVGRPTVDVLQALVRKSLLFRLPDARFDTYGVVRAFVATDPDAIVRHARVYAARGARAAAERTGPGVAEALDTLGRDRPHLEAAAERDPASAFQALVALAAWARARGSLDDARALLERALPLGDGPARGEVLAGLGWMRKASLDRAAEARGCFDEAVARGAITEGWHGLAHLHHLAGDLDAAEAALARAAPTDAHARAQVALEAAAIVAARGRTDEAITALRDLVVACRAQGVALVEGWVQRNLAVYAQQAGAFREARRAAVASLDVGRRVGLPMVELSALVTLGDLALAEGRPGDALEPLGQARGLAVRRGSGRHHLLVLVNLGTAHLAQGEDDAAEAVLTEACDGLLSTEAGRTTTGFAHALRGVVHALRGEVGDARAEASRAEAARVPAVDRLAGLLSAWLDGADDLPDRLAGGAADEVAEVRIASARLALR